jgi:hypothetical protein
MYVKRGVTKGLARSCRTAPQKKRPCQTQSRFDHPGADAWVPSVFPLQLAAIRTGPGPEALRHRLSPGLPIPLFAVPIIPNVRLQIKRKVDIF